MKRIALTTAALVLAGCAGKAPPPERITVREPVEVRIPVPVPCKAPPELLAPIEIALPEFVATCPPASSGLTPDGERHLQLLIVEHQKRLRAWRAHDTECRGATQN